jgi:hypothetical protein
LIAHGQFIKLVDEQQLNLRLWGPIRVPYSHGSIVSRSLIVDSSCGFRTDLGISHSLSSSKPQPAANNRSRAIWSQSHSVSLAPLKSSSAHMASGSEPSRGNTNSDHIFKFYVSAVCLKLFVFILGRHTASIII